MRKAITVYLAALVVALTFNATASAAIAAGTYVVQPGDTLFKIAQRFQTSATAISNANSLHTSTIYPGQTLALPGASTGTGQNYTVKPGDTLFLIAQKYGINYLQLQQANNLGTSEIYPGQSLVIPTAGQALKVPAQRTATLGSRGSFSWRDVDLIARVVNGEARGESYIGQVAVAAVILNRLQHKDFPKTVAGVIYQPLAFTAVADGQINAPLTNSALKAAREAINGSDPTLGALYYWNPATSTSKWIWSRKVTLTIGNHVFGI